MSSRNKEMEVMELLGALSKANKAAGNKTGYGVSSLGKATKEGRELSLVRRFSKEYEDLLRQRAKRTLKNSERNRMSFLRTQIPERKKRAEDLYNQVYEIVQHKLGLSNSEMEDAFPKLATQGDRSEKLKVMRRTLLKVERMLKEGDHENRTAVHRALPRLIHTGVLGYGNNAARENIDLGAAAVNAKNLGVLGLNGSLPRGGARQTRRRRA